MLTLQQVRDFVFPPAVRPSLERKLDELEQMAAELGDDFAVESTRQEKRMARRYGSRS